MNAELQFYGMEFDRLIPNLLRLKSSPDTDFAKMLGTGVILMKYA